MIIADPNIVIFDESTSALDTQTEARVFGKLQPFLNARTTIIIAHRLSTIENADYIYLIDDGRIKEEGTLAELLSTQGHFSTFFKP
jgi:ATP-binding cassette subfamily C protein